jgi:hypothetical protein
LDVARFSTGARADKDALGGMPGRVLASVHAFDVELLSALNSVALAQFCGQHDLTL